MREAQRAPVVREMMRGRGFMEGGIRLIFRSLIG